MIEIEFEEPKIEKCDCCGQEIVRLTRFVHKNDNAFAVYYIKFTRGHFPNVAYGIIGLGEWGEGSEPKDRVAFTFKIWTNESHYQVGLVDAEESPWSYVTFLGQILNRDEGLKHKWIKDVFHITDHIVAEDKIVVDYFTKSVEP
jgi:hypothetical protein